MEEVKSANKELSTNRRKSITHIISGIILINGFNIFYSILDIGSGMFIYGNIFEAIELGNINGDENSHYIKVIYLVVMLLGYMQYSQGISRINKTLDTVGRNALIKVLCGVSISFVAVIFVTVFPMPLVVAILQLLAFAILTLGYLGFRKSDILNAKGKSGSSLLYSAAIILLAICVLDSIAVIGDFLMCYKTKSGIFIGEITAFILLLVGWVRIKKSLK